MVEDTVYCLGHTLAIQWRYSNRSSLQDLKKDSVIFGETMVYSLVACFEMQIFPKAPDGPQYSLVACVADIPQGTQ